MTTGNTYQDIPAGLRFDHPELQQARDELFEASAVLYSLRQQQFNYSYAIPVAERRVKAALSWVWDAQHASWSGLSLCSSHGG